MGPRFAVMNSDKRMEISYASWTGNWRRVRDSNPRRAFDPYTLSRGAPSTTRPTLRRRPQALKIPRLPLQTRDHKGNRPKGQSCRDQPRAATDSLARVGSSPRSFLIRSKISSRCTDTVLGAFTPTLTWLPLTPSTVTVTSSPMTTASPTRRVRINMVDTLLRLDERHSPGGAGGNKSEKP